MVDANVWWNRFGALTGLVAFCVMVVAQGVTGSFDGDLDPTDSAGRIAAELANRNEAGPVIFLVGLLFFFLFLTYLKRHLQQSEDSWLADVFFGGSVALVVALFVASSIGLAMTVGDFSSDPEVAKTLFALEWNLAWLFAPGVIAAAGAAAAMSFRFGALPRWLGGLAVMVAVTGLMPWIGFLAFFAWTAITSVTLLVQQFRSAV